MHRWQSEQTKRAQLAGLIIIWFVLLNGCTDTAPAPHESVVASSSTPTSQATTSHRIPSVIRPKVVGQLLGHTDKITALAFHPNGHMLASGSDDRTIRFWRIRDHKPDANLLRKHTGSIDELAFGIGGAVLASLSATPNDLELLFWDTTSRQLLDERHFDGPPSAGHLLAISTDDHTMAWAERQLVGGSYQYEIVLWDARTGADLGRLQHAGHSDVASLAFSPDGTTLAVAEYLDPTIYLWNTKRKELLGRLKDGHGRWISDLAFSPDGRILVSASSENFKTLTVWDVAQRQQLGSLPNRSTQPVTRQGGTLPNAESAVYSIAFSPNGKLLAAATAEGVSLWDPIRRVRIAAPMANTGQPVAFSPDGSLLAVGDPYLDPSSSEGGEHARSGSGRITLLNVQQRPIPGDRP